MIENYDKLIFIFGTTNHQSTLILTSRIKPEQITFLETKKGKNFSMNIVSSPLLGMETINKHQIKGSLTQKQLFSQQYDHNQILLNQVAPYLKTLFNNDLESFFAQKIIFFDKMLEFLEQHFIFLSLLEKDILQKLLVSKKNKRITR